MKNFVWSMIVMMLLSVFIVPEVSAGCVRGKVFKRGARARAVVRFVGRVLPRNWGR